MVVHGIDEQWAADLVEVQQLSCYNKGVRYLLTVVDVFSKYVWVRSLTRKTGVEVERAFQSIFREGRKPLRLQTDDGKEFYSKSVSAFVKHHYVYHFSTKGDSKARVVERFNCTLKERLYRYFTAKNTLDYKEALPDVVRGYNATAHSRHLTVSPWLTVRKCGKRCTVKDSNGLNRQCCKWGIEYASTKSSVPSKRGTCPAGRIHCGQSETRTRTHLQDYRVGRYALGG